MDQKDHNHLQLMHGTELAHNLSLREQTEEVREALANQLRDLLAILTGGEPAS